MPRKHLIPVSGPHLYDPSVHCHMGFDSGSYVLNGMELTVGETRVFTAPHKGTDADDDGAEPGQQKVVAFCKTALVLVSPEDLLARDIPAAAFADNMVQVLKITGLATDHRFQRRGLARVLVAAAHEEGRQKGAAITCVHPLNDAATGHYLRNGFDVTERHGLKVLVYMPGAAP